MAACINHAPSKRLVESGIDMENGVPKHWKFCSFAAITIIALAPQIALAATASPEALNAIPDLFQARFQGMQGTLLGYARSLFMILAGIEFSYAMISIAFKRGDLGDISAALIQQILFIGLGLFIIQNGANLGNIIVQSFGEAGGSAATSVGGSAGLSPADIFSSGMALGQAMLDKMTITELGDSIVMGIVAIVTMVVFALIVAMMIMTLVAAWGISTMSVLFLGFAGSRWTKDVAYKAIIGVFGVGAKLFVMQIIVGVGQTLFADFAAAGIDDINDGIVMLGFAVVMLALVKVIPDMVQALISGASFTGGGALVGAMGGMAASAGGAMSAMSSAGEAAIGAGMAMNSAGKLASEQLKSSSNNEIAPKGTGAQFMTSAAMATGNLAKAAMADIGSRLSGQHMGHGTMGGRMSADMNFQAGQLNGSRAASEIASGNDNGESNESGTKSPIQTQLQDQEQAEPNQGNSISAE